MNKPALRDTTHPDFPHGTRTGYNRGCHRGDPCPATPTCADVNLRLKKKRDLRALNGIVGPKDLVDPTPALEVLDRMYEELRSFEVVGEVVGLTWQQVYNLIAREHTHVQRATADRIIAVADIDLTTVPRRRYPISRMRQILGSLAAQGYPASWCYREMGYRTKFSAAGNAKYISHRNMTRLLALKEQVGDAYATPETTGVPAHIIARTKRQAERQGWRPQQYCDDTGDYNPRLDPDHPWAESDTECGLLIALAGRLVRPGWSPEEEPYNVIVARFEPTYGDGVYEEKVQRAAKALRVGPKTPDREENAAAVRAVLAEVDAGTLDVVRAAVDLHLASWGNGNATVPRDHPAIADLVKEDDKERAKRAAAYRERQQALKKEQKRRKRAQKRAQRAEVEAA